MPVGVVHVLEMVDIQEDDAERFFESLCSVHFFFDGPVHIAAVRKLREFIGSRNDVEFLVSLF